MIAFINIGSNLGDRLSFIERAVAEIENRLDAKALRAPLEYSKPWGFDSDNEFINLGIAIEVGERKPLEILDILQQAEKKIDPAPHRDPLGNYIDRAIDIDFIALDSLDLKVDSSRLTLPHPHLPDRQFFIRPFLYLLDVIQKG